MPTLPNTILPTISDIYNTYLPGPQREHLGASIIGKECVRALWYDFRWCTEPSFPQRVLRLFETGNREESRVIENLRAAGITVYDRDPDNPDKQIKYEMFGNHYSGSLDGIGVGFKESSKYHVIEIKTSNTKGFRDLEKKGVEKSKPVHHCQVQQYMGWSKLDRAFYFCVCKETDEVYGERIYYNPDLVKRLEKKAHDVIFSKEPSFRQGDMGTLICKFCNHSSICHGGRLPLVNCRTCAHVTPLETGGWECGRDGSKINRLKQREGCDKHIFIPSLVPREQTDASEEHGTITYGEFVNGPGAILSIWLQGVLDDSP